MVDREWLERRKFGWHRSKQTILLLCCCCCSLLDFYARLVGFCCCALLGLEGDPVASFESSHQPSAMMMTVVCSGSGSSCEVGESATTTTTFMAPSSSSSLNVPEDLFEIIFAYVSSGASIA